MWSLEPERYHRSTGLWRQYRGGDRGAATELYELITPRTLAWAGRRYGDELAEEAVSRAWLLLLESPDKFDCGRGVPFVAFFNGVVRKISRRLYHEKGRRVDGIDLEGVAVEQRGAIGEDPLLEERILRCWFDRLTFLERVMLVQRCQGLDEALPISVLDWTPERVESALRDHWGSAEEDTRISAVMGRTDPGNSLRGKIYRAKKKLLVCLGLLNESASAEAAGRNIGEREQP